MRTRMVAALLAVFALAACGDSAEWGKDSAHYVGVETPHGVVPCIVVNLNGYVGGVSCDWSPR